MNTILVSTSVDLLDALRPSSSMWLESAVNPGTPPLWLFRGQRDAEWELLPSRMRSNTIDPNDVRYREFVDVSFFRELCDREALLPPKFDIPLGEENGQWTVNAGVDIPEGALQLYALAQHHGINTRLLDWSESPYTAAFFAAYGAWQDINSDKPSGTENFAIWGLCHYGSRQIKIIKPEYSQNQFLRNQRGRFSIDHKSEINFCKNNCWVGHNQLVEEDESRTDGTVSTGRLLLQKIVAPCSIAQDVLVHLRFEGYDLVSLQPSLDNCARWAVESRKLLNLKPKK